MSARGFMLGAAFFLAAALMGAEVRLGPEVAPSEPAESTEIDPRIARGPQGVFTVWADWLSTVVRGALNGRSFVIDEAGAGERVSRPAVAAGHAVFLVAWRHDSLGEKDRVFARRFDFGGHPIDAQPFVIDASEPTLYRRDLSAPSIAFDGVNFLVAWSRGRASAILSTASVQTVLIGEQGPPAATRESTFPAGFDIAGTREVRALWTGSEFYVVYTIEHTGHAGVVYTYYDLAARRFSRDNAPLGGAIPLLKYLPISSPAASVTLAGSRLSVVWIDQNLDVAAAQMTLDGEITAAPRVVFDRPTADVLSAIDVAWNGAEHVVTWRQGSLVATMRPLRAIRLDLDLRLIDAEPFDVAAPGLYDSPPALLPMPPGLAIAYSRGEGPNGGMRVFMRTLDAVPAAALADLAVENVTVTPDPLRAGASVTVRYRIRNLGASAAAPSTTHVSIGPGGALIAEKDFAAGIIPAGGFADEARELSLSLTASPGQYTVTVTADHRNAVAQTSRANDSAAASLTIVPPPPCAFTLRPAETIVPAAGGSGTIDVIASEPTCEWTFLPPSGAAWLTVRETTGRGDGVIRFSAAPNPSADIRSATLTVGNATAVVRQTAGMARRRAARP